MECRITFFVTTAERTATGWLVQGEVGLGPPQPGDEFVAVQHMDPPREDRAVLHVDAATAESLTLTGGSDIAVGSGDILVGITER